MKGSSEIIWELGAALKSKGNLPIKSIIVSDCKTNIDADLIDVLASPEGVK